MSRYEKKQEALIEKNLIENYEQYYRLAYSYVKNEPDARDIVQEAAYKAICKSSTLKDPEYVRNWIYRIVINEAYTMLRRMQKELDHMWEREQPSEDCCEDMALHQAIHRLREEEQTIIYLRYYKEKRLEEIAELTQQNLSTVKSRLYRAVKKLKQELERGAI